PPAPWQSPRVFRDFCSLIFWPDTLRDRPHRRGMVPPVGEKCYIDKALAGPRPANAKLLTRPYLLLFSIPQLIPELPPQTIPQRAPFSEHIEHRKRRE